MTSPSVPVEQMACAAGTLRRASRSLTRVYDVHLARGGLTTVQFSLLRTIQQRGGCIALAELADVLLCERTSLYRALSPLRRAGLVTVRAGTDRRAREVVLTSRAAHRISAAMPHWIEAQRAVLDRFGADAWRDLAATLGQLTSISRGAALE